MIPFWRVENFKACRRSVSWPAYVRAWSIIPDQFSGRADGVFISEIPFPSTYAVNVTWPLWGSLVGIYFWVVRHLIWKAASERHGTNTVEMAPFVALKLWNLKSSSSGYSSRVLPSDSIVTWMPGRPLRIAIDSWFVGISHNSASDREVTMWWQSGCRGDSRM